METVTIFTDGSSRGNPGPGGYGAICVYPDAKGQYKVTELGGGEKETTNNRMELQGLISALKYMQDFYQKDSGIIFSLFIDSSYVLKGAKEWLPNWKRKNWITSTKEEVKNSDLWQQIDSLLEKYKDNKIKFEWNLIKGHSGIPGNERCDIIATSFADDAEVDLYSGLITGYSVSNILETRKFSGSEDAAKKSKKEKNSKPAYSYISFVDGELFIDKTWAVCESRVKGKSKAKFKKAISAEDQQKIVEEFLSK